MWFLKTSPILINEHQSIAHDKFLLSYSYLRVFYLPLFLFFCHYLSFLHFHFFSQVATFELHADVKSTLPFEKGSAALNLLSFIFISECKFTKIA